MKEISENIKKEIYENIEDDLEDILEKISNILDKKGIVGVNRSRISMISMENKKEISEKDDPESFKILERCKDKIEKLTKDDIDKLTDIGKELSQTSLAAIKTREDHPAYLGVYNCAGEYLKKGDIMKGCVSLEEAKKIRKGI